MRTRPFLKWAGGKFRLLDAILHNLPQGQRLVEPFVGAGAVFLNADYPEFLLCDSNADLIALFKNIHEQGPTYIAYCKSFFLQHTNTEHAFYAMREAFNTSNDGAERGALLLYLNRHAFNGLVRYNARGAYNVPFGRYRKPYFPEKELLHFYEKSRTCAMIFAVQPFENTFTQLRPGDVVYADPPYTPLSRTANFTAYVGTLFAEPDQRRLACCALAAWQQHIPVVISNHDTPFTRTLYQQAALHHFEVQRSISCHGTTRAKVSELLAVYA